MKLKVIIITVLSIFLLAGCSNKQNSIHQDTKVEYEKRVKLIESNRKNWDEKIKKAKKLDQSKFKNNFTTVPSRYNDEDMSLARLKSGNQFVIEGQVINLTPMFNVQLAPETKATIYVKKVISGDKSLQGENIYTEFSGGLTKAKDLYTNFGITDPKQIVYDEKATFPMPKIGNYVVMGMNRYQPEDDKQQSRYQHVGLTTKNFYPINNSEVTFWVKDNDKFRLNNPAFYHKGIKKDYPNIFKLTKELNKLL